MYYIYEVGKPNEPYVFSEPNEPAIFKTETQANAMCKMMNAVASTKEFKVAKM
jgi:hypothetical protein